MKKSAPLLLFLVFLSVVIGYLFSRMSFIGRLALQFPTFASYRFLKIWWQGALLIFGIFIVLLLLQSGVNRFFARRTAVVIHLLCVAIAIWGLYATYDDFQHYYAHRWLKERFHLGGYLFWFGWLAISWFCIRREPALPSPVVEDIR